METPLQRLTGYNSLNTVHCDALWRLPASLALTRLERR